MNVNADALSRNPIEDKEEKSRYLQVDDNDTYFYDFSRKNVFQENFYKK